MFRASLVSACLLALLFWGPASATAQQGGGANAWQNSFAQSVYWLQTPQIQKELEIVPEQIERLRAVQQDSITHIREAYGKLTDVPAEERQARYYDILREQNEETERQLLEILLPQQIKRLKQILLQQRLAQLQWGGAAAFQTAEVAEALNITAEQREQLQQTEQQLRQEFQEKTQAFYKQLQDESREKLLNVLTIEQRRRLEALVGEKFEWQRTTLQPGQAAAAEKNDAKK
jgi:hypothetical protein